MNKTLLAGGCSFTFGNELSDDIKWKNTFAKNMDSIIVKRNK
jgi:hypothetical protein